MFCENCGSPINENELFCAKCGARVNASETRNLNDFMAKTPEEVSIAPTSEPAPVPDTFGQAPAQEPQVQASMPDTFGQAPAQEPQVQASMPDTFGQAPAQEPQVQATVPDTFGQAPAQEPQMKASMPNTFGQAPAQGMQGDMFDMPAYVTPGVSQGASFGSEPKANKKKKFPIIPVAILGVVLVAVLLVVLNFESVSNTFRQTISSPEDYYQYVEKKQMEELTSSVSNSYQALGANSIDYSNMSSDIQISLELSEDARDMIAEASGLEETDWLEKMGMTLFTSVKDSVMEVDASVSVGEDSLISGDVVMDMGMGEAYFRVPELSNQYIGFDLNEISAGSDISMEELAEMMSMYEEMYAAYPDQKTIESMMERYLTIIIESIDEVEKEKDTLKVGDMEQKCTVLVAELTEEDALEILEKICEEAKDDKDLLKVIKSFAAAYDYDEDEMEEEFLAALDDALDEIEYAKENTSDEELVIRVWVNSKGEIVGRDFTVEDAMEITYYTLQKGSKYETEMTYTDGYGDSVEITGSGTIKSDVMNGVYEITYAEEDFAEITVKDYDMKKAEQGFISGTFIVKPSDGLWDQAGAGAASALLEDYALSVTVAIDKNTASYDIAVLDGDDVFGKLVMTGTYGEGKTAAVSDSQVVMYETDEDLIEWMKTMDFNSLIGKLEDSSLPEEFVEEAKTTLEQLELMLSYY